MAPIEGDPRLYMALHLFNTSSRSSELFVPGDPDHVTMYVCGPTVYGFAHIGNARPNVVFDVLARLLRRDFRLTYARNITDVDDKINAAARAEGLPIGALTARYIAAFHEDMATLGVLAPDVEPRVTGNIPQIVDLIARLIVAGHAYEAEGHVLFSVQSFPAYGRLSGRDPEEMLAGARVEVAPYKRNPGDFVLWKPSAADVVGWESPWGRGRPGWHVECSAMVEAHLGETIDIHGGGQDLVFPHHENEVAQSTCAHGGRLYCRYWVHNGLVHVESEKMSKSLGNILLVRDLLARAPAEAVRLALLSAHYRQPLDWNEQLLLESEQKLDRMYGVLRAADITGARPSPPSEEPPAEIIAALEDDLNTPRALAELFSLARAANRSADPRERAALARSLRCGAWLLGLLGADPLAWFRRAAAEAGEQPEEAEIDALVARRDAMRRERNYQEADRIRDQLADLGVVVEDGAEGSFWRRIRQ
jgi:cysteinyl-tRNA synthetase